MFKWLNKQGVEGEGKFYLQRTDRFHYEYGEGEVRIKISVDPSSKGEEVYLGDALSFDSPDHRRRIAGNVSAALGFMGVRFQLR